MAMPMLLSIILILSVLPIIEPRSVDSEDLLDELVRELREYGLQERASSRGGAGDDVIKAGPLVGAGAQAPSVRIGAFNIQVFGDKKYSKTTVKEYLLKILPRYDVLLIQEIRDADGDSFIKLMMDLNEIRSYEFELSGRLGRSSSKEQYAYIYDPSKFQAESSYQYQNSRDSFERPPFGVVLTSSVTAIERFGLLGVHTKPTAAPEEISKMADVYDDFKSKFNLEDVILMGDFNGGCSYVTSSEWAHVNLRTEKRFTWWIGDEVDTTVGSSDCAYDRIVSAGQNMKAAIIPSSVNIYRFDQEYGLRQSDADDISDHYPVEISLYGKLNSEASALTVKESFSVSGSVTFDASKIPNRILDYTVTSYESGVMVELRKADIPCADVVKSLKGLAKKVPALLTRSIIAAVEKYLATGILEHVIRFPGNLDEPSANCDVSMRYKDNNVVVRVSKTVM